jgi:hypothetical protein
VELKAGDDVRRQLSNAHALRLVGYSSNKKCLVSAFDAALVRSMRNRMPEDFGERRS